ncbi:hypothetical protein N7452_010054 [Penicillium brevicompactum]|uniref:Uncharacterized protein n=1 Tax=Penicillium brevicompactum TaxID=5074 RepID=A0A9W9QB03_PENBR|nr:hypothetical protein N7452_010054 [Penicillium brevicompactum]
MSKKVRTEPLTRSVRGGALGSTSGGEKTTSKSLIARSESRLSLDERSVDPRLGPVPERGEGLVPDTPKTGMSSSSCERADQKTEYSREFARSRLAGKGEKGRRAPEEEGPRPEGGPAEMEFRRQGLEGQPSSDMKR